MNSQIVKKIVKNIVNFLLRRHIKTSHSIVYVKDKVTSKIIIEYSRLFIPYKMNKKTESELLIKIKDSLHNFVQVNMHNNSFLFIEKRGLRYTASIECFCDTKDVFLIKNRLKNLYVNL